EEILLVAGGRQAQHGLADVRQFDRHVPVGGLEVEREGVEREIDLADLAARRARDLRPDLGPEREPPERDELPVALGDEERAYRLARGRGVLARCDEAAREHLVAEPRRVRLGLVAVDVLLLPARERAQLEATRRGGRRSRARRGRVQRTLDASTHRV